MRDFIGYGLADEGPNKNVLNIIRVLVEDKDSTIYIPYDYMTEKTNKERDPKLHFLPKESGRPLQVVDVQGNKERFNLSVKCLVDVKVEVAENEGTENEVINLVDKKVWRNYNIFRDGELVIDHIVAKLSENAFNELKAAGGILYLGDKELTNGFPYDATMIYTIRFNGLPLVSCNWARPNALNFHEMLLKSQRLAEQIKQGKKYIKENIAFVNEPEDDTIYKENVSYNNNKVGKEVPCVTYTIVENPGYKVPKFEASQTVVKDVDRMKKEQNDLDFKCFCIKWALETSVKKNSYTWGDLYQKRKNSSKYYQETIVDIDGVSYRLERCQYNKAI